MLYNGRGKEIPFTVVYPTAAKQKCTPFFKTPADGLLDALKGRSIYKWPDLGLLVQWVTYPQPTGRVYKCLAELVIHGAMDKQPARGCAFLSCIDKRAIGCLLCRQVRVGLALMIVPGLPSIAGPPPPTR